MLADVFLFSSPPWPPALDSTTGRRAAIVCVLSHEGFGGAAGVGSFMPSIADSLTQPKRASKWEG